MKTGWLIALLLFSITGCNREPEAPVTIPVATPTSTQVTVSEQSVEPRRIVLDKDDPAERVPDDSKYKVLYPGTFFGDGASYGVKNGDNWLGLFKSGDQMILRNTRVVVKHIRASPSEVRIGGEGRPILFLKGPGITAGNVSAFFCPPSHNYYSSENMIPERGYLDELFMQKYSFGGSEYLFRGGHSPLAAKYSTTIVPILTIESENGTQVVPGAWLDLIADLDKDGKPDILIDVERGGSVFIPVLYLSSEAKPSKLVQAVAEMDVWGD